MKVGLVNIFSFRPHVEHLFYLSQLLESDGHKSFFLTCDASVPKCYARAIKGAGKLKECSKCILGGIRSYPVTDITSISDKHADPDLSYEEHNEITLSSSCTLNRTESEVEWDDAEVISTRESLHESVLTSFRSVMKWISDYQLDAVICFNGRMDMTRAITYACERSGIPYITHERTWFGDGLHLVSNANCLSIKAMSEMVAEFDDKPLHERQAQYAGKLIALRFLQQNTLEWRLYNKNAKSIDWPLNSKGRKVLVLPSSKNEFAGHEEWKSGWVDNTSALDDFFKAFSIDYSDVVIRFHPNWAENIGRVSGERSLAHYTQWAKERGVYFISSEEKANTYDLIQQADIVVMNGGSSAVEAGACGKQVICLGPSTYQNAGFVRTFLTKEDLYRPDALIDIDSEEIIKKTLRFVYLRAKRFPQFTDYVKAIKTTKYQYFDGADPGRIINMLETNKVSADDAEFANDEVEENSVVHALRNKQWQQLFEYEWHDESMKKTIDIQRRFGLRWVDTLRARFELGDRG